MDNLVSTSFSELEGKVISSVRRGDDASEYGSWYEGDFIEFITTENEKYVMLHVQDCCEYVHIEDIVGDLEDIINTPIIVAEERTNKGEDDFGDEYFTWTFYTLRTNKTTIDIRWYGTSNGYYSEDADFFKVEERNTPKGTVITLG